MTDVVRFEVGGVGGNCGAARIYKRTYHSGYASTHNSNLANVILNITRKLIILNPLAVPEIATDPEVQSKLKGTHAVFAGNQLLLVSPKNHPFTYPSVSDLNDNVPFRAPTILGATAPDLSAMSCIKDRLKFTTVTSDQLAGYLDAAYVKHSRVKDKVYVYSGAHATRVPQCTIKTACGMFAVSLLARAQEQHGVKPRDQWYQLGDSDWHVAFPCPLYLNTVYYWHGLPHSGDSFAILLFKGTEPPPIYVGGFTKVTQKIRSHS